MAWVQVLDTEVLQHYPDEYVGDEAVGPTGVRVHGFCLDKVTYLSDVLSPYPTAALLVGAGFARQALPSGSLVGWAGDMGRAEGCHRPFATRRSRRQGNARRAPQGRSPHQMVSSKRNVRPRGGALWISALDAVLTRVDHGRACGRPGLMGMSGAGKACI